ncbi:MAG: ribosome maturation factor RimM [Bacteroidota bacterium]
MKEATIHIGNLKKAYGLEGEIRVYIKDYHLEDLVNTEVVFVEIAGQKVPYFIEDVLEAGGILVKLEDVDSKEQATQLTNCQLYLRPSDLVPDEEREMLSLHSLEQLIGYMIHDDDQAVGAIEEIIEMPQHFLAQIQYQNREVLIPLHDELVVEIDSSQQILRMNLPEGLLEL